MPLEFRSCNPLVGTEFYSDSSHFSQLFHTDRVLARYYIIVALITSIYNYEYLFTSVHIFTVGPFTS